MGSLRTANKKHNRAIVFANRPVVAVTPAKTAKTKTKTA